MEYSPGSCPKCKSVNTCSLPSIYESRHSAGSFQGVSALKADPPSPPRFTKGAHILTIGIALASALIAYCIANLAGLPGENQRRIIFPIFVLGAIAGFKVADKTVMTKQRELWHAKIREWSETWVCQDCGAVWQVPLD